MAKCSLRLSFLDVSPGDTVSLVIHPSPVNLILISKFISIPVFLLSPGDHDKDTPTLGNQAADLVLSRSLTRKTPGAVI